MAHEIIMPALGMAQETGRLVAWLKNEGDTVSKGDPLMEVETDKSTMEVEAPKDGFLVNITALANTDVPVGDVVAYIVENLNDAPAKLVKESPLDSEQEAITAQEPQHQASNQADADTKVRIAEPTYNPVKTNKEAKILASPKLRSLAASENLDLQVLRNAGHPEPFKAADMTTLRQLSIRPNISLRNNATSLVDKTSFNIFLSEINSASQMAVSSELVLASFISASLRVTTNADNIGISYKSGPELQSTMYYNPDKQQLADIVPAEHDILATAEICDLTSTDFIQLSGDTNSNIIITISNFTEQFMVTLDWDPNALSQIEALELLRDFSTRIKSPLKQLL
jgi:hypothetical protein